MKERALGLLKAARIASQALCAAGFLYVFLTSRNPFAVVQNPFLRWDPLIFLTNPRAEPLLLLPVCALLLLAVVLGRAFCGWICPMGSLIELSDMLLSPLRRRNPFALRSPRPRSTLVRFPPSLVLLGATIVAIYSDAGVLPFLHPNVWIVRICSLSVLGLVFLGLVVIASAFGRRLWCVYLCPLGALYGTLARLPLPRLAIRRCVHCGSCDRCPMQAADASTRTILAHQCTLCFEFEGDCRVEGFAFARKAARHPGFDPGRRQFLIAGAGLLGGALTGGTLGIVGARRTYGGGGAGVLSGAPSAVRIAALRPPGVVEEETFLRRCIRCHHCVESCPNRIIEPAGLEDGVSGLFAPRLHFNRNGCDFRCQVCQLVCPNQAIPLQALQDKQKTAIGLAMINQDTCVVFKDRKPCLVCEEVCPTPEKAVVFPRQESIMRSSGPAVLKFPSVVESRCIGCGICQANCPAPLVAITVSRLPRGHS
jgi:formate hydrogenlyase subunit 6/NADH:ubiquinone oxidoreductase subunit I